MRRKATEKPCLIRALAFAFLLMLISLYMIIIYTPLLNNTGAKIFKTVEKGGALEHQQLQENEKQQKQQRQKERQEEEQQQQMKHLHQLSQEQQQQRKQQQYDFPKQTKSEWLGISPDNERLSDYGDGTCFPNHDVEHMRGILQRWHDIATANNVTYFLTYGSLIGAVRDGQIVPWDTDLDVYTDMRDNLKLDLVKDKRNFETHSFDYHLVLDVDWRVTNLTNRRRVTCDGRMNTRDSCTFNGPVGRLIRGYEQYLDIWDVEHVNGKVFDRYGPGFYYLKEDIYPLKKCMLAGVITWCPRNPKVIFDAFYGKDTDMAPKWICRRGKWIERVS